MQRGRTRILIDCSFIDFTKQPTGIPRVVLSYIDIGYQWGMKNGIDVIPFVPTQNGLIIYRPLPGQNPPEDLVEKVDASNRAHAIPAAVQVASDAANYLAAVATAIVNVPAAVFPSAGGRALVSKIETELNRQASKILARRSAKADEFARLEPGPGDVVFAPAYWHDVDPSIYRKIKKSGAKIVILVHDILPIVFEKFYPSPWRYQFRESVLQTTTYADALFCVSDYTKRSVAEFLTRQKRRLPMMMTAYNGFEPLVSNEGMTMITSKIELSNSSNSTVTQLIRHKNPYIMVGSVEPKKGHLPTIRCFESMWAAGLDRSLVIIGRKGWMEQEITEAIETSIYYGDKLHWFSGLDDFDLADAYIHSHALIMSSVAEGFGIPMIEASFYGKPSIVFDTPIAREIIGDIGLFFNNASSLVEHVISMEDDTAYKKACCISKDFIWPSWEECTPSILDQLAQIANPAIT
ncbi:glycosyltransferase [Lichenihabitans sp. PAMC28606]|uniref:glycosyltransferase n=1 Tax=Lichenihabitans sp. PAMC28606 TaxID=2880932 RepID=UPI001D0B6082|nr:glycosyltransferase [Lichenihabitans sp. PAMC28606]UDL93385.1 glycosyltransferase [Lichenihabitans sp. PAMC28606]